MRYAPSNYARPKQTEQPEEITYKGLVVYSYRTTGRVSKVHWVIADPRHNYSYPAKGVTIYGSIASLADAKKLIDTDVRLINLSRELVGQTIAERKAIDLANRDFNALESVAIFLKSECYNIAYGEILKEIKRRLGDRYDEWAKRNGLIDIVEIFE